MITTHASVPILGVPIHHVTFDQALDRIVELASEGRADGRSRQVATVNTDFLVSAYRDPEIHTMLQRVDLAVADGMPVVWASSWLGGELPQRVAGADLVPALGRALAGTDLRLMFFGGAGDSAADAAAILRERHPDLEIASATGMIGADGSAPDAVVDQLRDFSPDVLCVGLGHPKQERFIQRHAATLGVPVSMGVGASFEFISGDRARAPRWMQRSGLEWLHRLVTDFRRLSGRYLTDARVFFPAVRRQRRLAPANGPTTLAADLDLTGRDTLSAEDLVVLSTTITSTRAHNEQVEVIGMTPSVRTQLDDLKLLPLLEAGTPHDPPKAASS
ncbi:MAG: WecB/TagA/CpsF family glycosyltransferase [Actinomycetota bacterium]